MISIKFEYDQENDIHIAFPVCEIMSEDDCVAWAKAYADYFVPLKQRVDVVFVCDMLTINPAMGTRWGEYRRAVLSRFVRYHVRVSTAAGNIIDAVSFGTATPPNYAVDIPTAISHIRHMRLESDRRAG